jgi:hypothetical protein
MEHVKETVSRLVQCHDIDLTISRQRQKRIESLELIRSHDPGNERPPLAFNARPFVLCGLPIRRPLPGTLRYTRRNGRFKLEIVGHPDYGYHSAKAA